MLMKDSTGEGDVRFYLRLVDGQTTINDGNRNRYMYYVQWSLLSLLGKSSLFVSSCSDIQ